MKLRRWYERTILDERPGLGPSLARSLFGLASIAYALGLSLRRLAYGCGLVRVYRAPVPVISVGNLTTGGTGKTPAALWLCRRLAQRGLRVALLARGYGRAGDGPDDEAPAPGALPEGVVRLVGPRRDRLAAEAVERHGAQAIVLDDGFQHWRLARDFDLVCVDALDPFGNERLLPAGPLREPMSALRRASAFLLTRTNLCPSEELGALRARMRALAEGRPVADSAHRPVSLLAPGAPRERPLEWLRGRRVYAFCGIGSPRGFRKTLTALGAALVQFRAFPDHHRYRPIDLNRIAAEAKEFMAEALVTTEKDAARLSGASFPLPLLLLTVELEVTRGLEALEAAAAEALGAAGRPVQAAPREGAP